LARDFLLSSLDLAEWPADEDLLVSEDVLGALWVFDTVLGRYFPWVDSDELRPDILFDWEGWTEPEQV
jgi:hypothetical protein